MRYDQFFLSRPLLRHSQESLDVRGYKRESLRFRDRSVRLKCGLWTRQCDIPDILIPYAVRLTHAASNRVLRALSARSVPRPTVTLCSSRTTIWLFSESGGPGRLLPNQRHLSRSLEKVRLHPMGVPSLGERAGLSENHPYLRFSKLLREQVGFLRPH